MNNALISVKEVQMEHKGMTKALGAAIQTMRIYTYNQPMHSRGFGQSVDDDVYAAANLKSKENADYWANAWKQATEVHGFWDSVPVPCRVEVYGTLARVCCAPTSNLLTYE